MKYLIKIYNSKLDLKVSLDKLAVYHRTGKDFVVI